MGYEIEKALIQRYATLTKNSLSIKSNNNNNSNNNNSNRTVIIRSGSESLEDTIRIMRQASVLISVHSSAAANMMFMRPNTSYIEITPKDYKFDVMLRLANSLHILAYDYVSLS
eukprot:gene2574-5023_t